MTGPTVQPRLPFEPVFRAAGATNQSHAARLLGLPLRTVTRYIAGGIPINSADRLAGRIGCHPSELWGDEWTSLLNKQAEQRRLTRILWDRGDYDRRCIHNHWPNRTWDENAHTWNQWALARDRAAYDRIDRQTEREAS